MMSDQQGSTISIRSHATVGYVICIDGVPIGEGCWQRDAEMIAGWLRNALPDILKIKDSCKETNRGGYEP